MSSQIEELKNQISNIQQKHSNDLGKLKQKLSELEKSQAKPLTGLIKDPEYEGDCFAVLVNGNTWTTTFKKGYKLKELKQGRTFYDIESAERFSKHEQLQYELSCATESGTDLYFLSWNIETEELGIGYYSYLYIRFGFNIRSDAESFAEKYTSKELKLMLGVGL
jgi:hypothetical protein